MTLIKRSGTLYKILREIRNRANLALMGLTAVHRTSYIHRTTTVAKDLVAEQYVFVGRGCEIGPLTFIGRYSMLAPGVSVIGGDHVMDVPGVPLQFSGRPRQQRTTIGRDVWIGTHAIIMRGLTLGDGAIIGAGAVVTRDVKPYEIVAGVPARKLGERFSTMEEKAAHSLRVNGDLIPPSFAAKQD